MENYNEQFEDIESKLKSEFQADLKGLLEPPGPVPQSVDKKIIGMAQKKLSKKHTYKFLRWLAPLAAAAVIIFALMLNEHLKQSQFAIDARKPLAREDIDRNGSVDILDAMKLDLKIKNAEAGVEYDFNKDGLINKKDVDVIAFNAVRIDKGVL